MPIVNLIIKLEVFTEATAEHDVFAVVDEVLDTGVLQDAINEYGDVKVLSALSAVDEEA